MQQLKLVRTPEEAQAEFEEFWKWYPLKKGKAKSREMYYKITTPGGWNTKSINKDSGTFMDLHLEATPEEIIAGVKAFWKSLPTKGDSYTRDTTYCPHPTTWLNQGRWEDE